MAGVELGGEKEANEFFTKYKNHVMRGRKLKLYLYSERLSHYKKNKPKYDKTDRPGAIYYHSVT